MDNQVVSAQTFMQGLKKWANDALAKRLLPETDYDLKTILEVIESGVIENCYSDLTQRHSLSISKINDIERFAKSYCSLLLRGENLPILEGIQVHEQMDKQIASNKVLLVLLFALSGVRIEA